MSAIDVATERIVRQNAAELAAAGFPSKAAHLLMEWEHANAMEARRLSALIGALRDQAVATQWSRENRRGAPME